MNNEILNIRGIKVIVDRDLAALCQVETKALNQTVKRHIELFSEIDRFQLNDEEMQELVTSYDRFKNLKHSTNPPFVFTKKGISVLSKILKKKH
ncbi:MAG: ORF6N domain-containing protein [Verrucomicrobiota bacterium]|nr:ORF6N domain-containing protein [Verrucomicrobiota bacterium]